MDFGCFLLHYETLITHAAETDLFLQCTDYKEPVLKLAVLPASCGLYLSTY